MSGATSTDADALATRARERAERLHEADEELEAAREAVREVGEERVVAAADAYREATALLDRYAERAAGTGAESFEAYVEFQERFARLVEELDDDVPDREAFEAAADRVDRRRLSESDFAAARDALAPAERHVDLLERRDDAEAAFRDTRHEARTLRDEIDERLAECSELRRLGEADLDADVGRLREPIERYDAAVEEAFATFRAEASARELFDLLETARQYPLVEWRRPPRALREYVTDHVAGTEPVPTLLEYADYSTSKLDHYVEAPGALRTTVATHRTYLERLDAAPLTVGWPPPTADRLRYAMRERLALVGRFADPETVAAGRAVRDLSHETEYDRLRTAAVARAELTEDERERLAAGEVKRERDELAAARDRLGDVLDAVD